MNVKEYTVIALAVMTVGAYVFNTWQEFKHDCHSLLDYVASFLWNTTVFGLVFAVLFYLYLNL